MDRLTIEFAEKGQKKMSLVSMLEKRLITHENSGVAERVVQNDALRKELSVLTEEKMLCNRNW